MLIYKYIISLIQHYFFLYMMPRIFASLPWEARHLRKTHRVPSSARNTIISVNARGYISLESRIVLNAWITHRDLRNIPRPRGTFGKFRVHVAEIRVWNRVVLPTQRPISGPLPAWPPRPKQIYLGAFALIFAGFGADPQVLGTFLLFLPVVATMWVERSLIRGKMRSRIIRRSRITDEQRSRPSGNVISVFEYKTWRVCHPRCDEHGETRENRSDQRTNVSCVAIPYLQPIVSLSRSTSSHERAIERDDICNYLALSFSNVWIILENVIFEKKTETKEMRNYTWKHFAQRRIDKFTQL